MLTLPLQAHHAMEKMEEFVYKVQEHVATHPRPGFRVLKPQARGWGRWQGLGRVTWAG